MASQKSLGKMRSAQRVEPPRFAHIKDLTPDPVNRRSHNPRNIGMVVDALQQVGAARSIVIDEDGVILAGNGVVEAAGEAGITRLKVVEADGQELVAVRRTGLTAAQKRHLAIADNRGAELATWNVEQLAADLKNGEDLSAFFYEDELKTLLAGPDGVKDGNTDPDEVPAERPTGIVAGDLFELGQHRLLCGDSTRVDHVDRLMDGAKAEMMHADPPYGVSYDGGHFHSGDVNIKRTRETLAGDDSTDCYAEFMPLAMTVVDGPCYVWFAGSLGRRVFAAVEDSGGIISAMIVWHKTNATYAAMNAQYKQRHEPCLYFKPKGSTLRWVGPSDACTLWEFKKEGVNKLHPTQKPVDLVSNALKNHDASTVYDPFLGSGTTLIAAEQLGRRCYGLEINPSYCQVIIDRWEAFTGQKAQKVGELVHA